VSVDQLQLQLDAARVGKGAQQVEAVQQACLTGQGQRLQVPQLHRQPYQATKNSPTPRQILLLLLFTWELCNFVPDALLQLCQPRQHAAGKALRGEQRRGEPQQRSAQRVCLLPLPLLLLGRLLLLPALPP
jgi:hypothetical protein